MYCPDVPVERNRHKTKSSFCGRSRTISTRNQCFPSRHSDSYGHYSRRTPQRVETLREFPSAPNNERLSAICVKYLSESHSDNSLKNGLLHMYTEYGGISYIQIYGNGSDRYAIIKFKKSEDSKKALDATHGRRLFGEKIQVSAHKSLDCICNKKEFREVYDVELDEYHPKATRILFIGGLGKEITISELRTHFEPFGDIIEISIQNQNSLTFAFCQYSDILSAVFAIKKLEGRFLGYNRIKLEFGLSVPNCCIWVGGVSDTLEDIALCEWLSRYGIITNRSINRENGCALIKFENERQASLAVTEMRGCILNGKKLRVDYASNELQDFFLEKLNKQDCSSHKDNNRSMMGRPNWEKREFEKNYLKRILHGYDGGGRLENRHGTSIPSDTACTANQLGGDENETWFSYSNQPFLEESESCTPAIREFETNSRQQTTISHSTRNQVSFLCKSNASCDSYRKRNEPLYEERSSSSILLRKNNPVGGKKSQMTRDKRTLFRKRLKLTKSLPKCTTVLQKLKVEKNIEVINKQLRQLLDLATQMEAAKDRSVDVKYDLNSPGYSS